MIQILKTTFLSIEWRESELDNVDLKNYKAKSGVLCSSASG